ncbi:PepSY domain-containing protein [Nitrososphaera viennensis]|nr:hypothetical protein [Nitrososphaera viennensis]
MAAVPFVASAQTTTGEDDDDNSNNTNNDTMTAPETNGTATTDQADNSTATEEETLTAPETDNATATTGQEDSTVIVGTIVVNSTQTVGDFDEDLLAVQEDNATQTAAAEVTNGTVVDSQLDVVQGFLVYTVTVLDVANQNLYHVIVDPGDGSVLYASPGIPVGNSYIEDVVGEIGGDSGDGGNSGDDDDDDNDE